jgi:hypothetical protein
LRQKVASGAHDILAATLNFIQKKIAPLGGPVVEDNLQLIVICCQI